MTYRELPLIGEELLEDYSIGDVVKYCADSLLEMKTGIILDIYSRTLSERRFPHATIYVIGENTREEVLLGNLTILSKVSN